MKALLVLEDGFTLEGRSFTGVVDSGGEVIFNTGMLGYQEMLTDPSCHGQMLCMTYPLIGNYGVNEEDMESAGVHAAALLVKECCKEPSNWRCAMSLPDFLVKHGVPGVEGLDTRALARHLCLHGSLRGVVSTTVDDVPALVARAKALPPTQGRNLAPLVSTKAPHAWVADEGWSGKLQGVTLNGDWRGTGVPLVVYDYGGTWGILRQLATNGFEPLVVPHDFRPEAVRATGAKAVFLSNGPGDPAAMQDEVAIARCLIDEYPVAGICLGHQLLGHAVGGSTFKLRFGHHGSNHPIKNLDTGHVEISAQSHEFCVNVDNVPDVRVTHVNLNDNTVEGFAHRTRPVISIQHNPETGPGPYESQYFLARFRKLVEKSAGM